jgi:hypothetical protein
MDADKIKMLNKSRDTMCLVSGIPYEKVIKLRDELKDNCIDANITTGGLQIYANYQDDRVIHLCKKYKTVAEAGVSRFVESAILKNE